MNYQHVTECKGSSPFTAMFTVEPCPYPESDKFDIHFFKHTECKASIYLHNFLKISASSKSIYALPSTLIAEDTQNGTYSRAMGENHFW
jgi:hypothetical protein